MSNNRSRMLQAIAVTSAALGAFACLPAMAQSAGADAAAAPAADEAQAGTTDQLAEVVVTAEKRSENLQALPQTVTAVNGAELYAQGVKDITDITRVAPEVSVTTGQLNNVSIRGVRTGSYGPTLDSANAVYLDGNYNARFTSLNGLFFDSQRIEVLDGPQGTLYGRNSAGGAINIISNKPTQTFGGYGFAEVGNYNDLSINGALNLPLSDTLAFRVALMRDYHSGFDHDSNTDDQDLRGGRAELLWKPSSNETLLLTAQESGTGGKGPGTSTITNVFKNPTIITDTTTGNVLAYNATCPAGHACTSRVVPINASPNPRANAVLVGLANLARSDNHNDDFALQNDYTFGNFADLTLQAARMSTNNGDGAIGSTAGYQQSPYLIASGLFGVDGGANAYASNGYVNDVWDSQELRLTSIATHPLQWVVGLYRYYERGTGADPTYTETPVTALGSQFGTIAIPGSASAVGGPPVASDLPNILNEDHAEAVFGQATWTPNFLSALHITGGLRENHEEKRGRMTVAPVGPIALGAYGGNGIFDQSNSWNAATYKVNISYDLTPQNMVYVDHSTGFQSGGFGYGSSPAYQPTHIWAWEIGTKNRFLNNTLQINASAWYYNYSGQTENVSDVFLVSFSPFAPPAPFNFIASTNAATSIDRGQSLDIQWNITADDQLGINVQHINSVFTGFNLTQRYLNLAAKFNPSNPLAEFNLLYPGYSTTGNQSGPSFNYNGTRTGSSPDWTTFATYSRTFHLSADRLFIPQVVFRYIGTEVNGNQEQPNMPPYNGFWMLPGYSTWDLYLTYQADGGKYAVTAFSRNLFNKLYATGRSYASNGAALMPSQALYAYETQTFGAPRMWGVQIQANF